MQQPIESSIVNVASSEPPAAIIDVPLSPNVRTRNVVLGLMAFVPFLILFMWLINLIGYNFLCGQLDSFHASGS
jgi:hypothetical protein